MSEVKKRCFVVVAIIAIAGMFLMAGCEEAKETGAESKVTVAESMLKGEIYENSKFSITVPDGWVITSDKENSVWLNISATSGQRNGIIRTLNLVLEE